VKELVEGCLPSVEVSSMAYERVNDLEEEDAEEL
jgi:hypothetical protein